MPKFICISGKARHGKDTVADMMRSELEARHNRVLITHYADLLKYICKAYFGWDGNKDEAGRTLLQHVGTDCVRKQNPNFWVDFILQIATLFADKWDYILVPDTRFPNEISRIKEQFDAVHIRVIRDEAGKELTQEQALHESEVALDHVTPDHSIYNCGSLEDLKENVTKLLDKLSFEDSRQLAICDPIPPADGA